MRTLQIPHSEQNVAAHNVTRSHSLEHITRFLSSLSILSHLHISLIFCTLPLLSILWDPPLILLSLYYPLAIIGFSTSIWLATCLWISPPHHIYNIDFFSVFKVSLKRHLLSLPILFDAVFFLILYFIDLFYAYCDFGIQLLVRCPSVPRNVVNVGGATKRISRMISIWIPQIHNYFLPIEMTSTSATKF